MEALSYQEEYKEYELIDGEVYMMARPSVNHWKVSNNIIRSFEKYLQGKTCEAFCEIDVHLSDKDNVIPDAMIICNPDIIKEDGIYGAPELVVEVLSPSTGLKDRTVKLFTYAKYGVKEYWLVEPKSKTVEVYLLKDGNFELDNIYYLYTDKEWSRLCDKDRELAETQKIIKVSLYDDFTVEVAEVFRGID